MTDQNIMLSQLVYVSERNQNCIKSEIDKILISSKNNNSELGITGILLYSERKFIQLLEGENETIKNLYEIIRRDSRHSRVMLIYHSPIEMRSFPSWHMGVRRMNEDNIHFKTDITTDDKIIFDNIINGEEANGKKVLNLINKFF